MQERREYKGKIIWRMKVKSFYLTKVSRLGTRFIKRVPYTARFYKVEGHDFNTVKAAKAFIDSEANCASVCTHQG